VSAARFKSLLAVQKHRVDRAMGVVLEKNETVRQRESDRDAARERAQQAVVAYQLVQQRLAESALAGGLAFQLAGASSRCEMQRTLIADTEQALGTAEEVLVSAEAEAVDARATYRRTLARQDALLSLQANWSRKRE
jgi:hypothetical protein